MPKKIVIKRVTVPHDDFLDFLDAMKALRPKELDEIFVSKEIFSKLDCGGKWYHRNGLVKPIFEFKWFGNGWYLVTEFRNIRKESSIYADETAIYVVQFDNEFPIEITIK